MRCMLVAEFDKAGFFQLFAVYYREVDSSASSVVESS